MRLTDLSFRGVRSGMRRTVDVEDAAYGFAYAEANGDRYLRNDDGELRRVSADAFDLLRALATGEVDREALPETASGIVDDLVAAGFLRADEPVVELHPPDDIRLWPRLLAFFALYAAAVPAGLHAFDTIRPIEQLLDPLVVAGILVLAAVSVAVHEAGHHFAARPYLDPDVRFGRLNGVVPAVITDTTGAWLLPRNRRLWITLAGPFAHLAFTWACVAATATVAPGNLPLHFIVLGNLVQVFSSMNPLIHGDGYLLAIDALGAEELKTRGIDDVRARDPTLAAGYVVLSYAYGVLSMVSFVVVLWLFVL